MIKYEESIMYRTKELIANKLLKEVIEYHAKYHIPIPLKILSAKYSKALKPVTLAMVIEDLESKGLIKKDLTITGRNLISPTKSAVEWLWL